MTTVLHDLVPDSRVVAGYVCKRCGFEVKSKSHLMRHEVQYCHQYHAPLQAQVKPTEVKPV